MPFTSETLRQALLAWYDASHRDLPWRQSTDPYRVWVSEIMLQQTRVDAVIPYYNRWLATFPDIDSLASAPLHDVLRHWEGLGYYSRARNLHSAARLVREHLDGRIPDTYEALRELPGVGEYTAGAIASISYNEKQPAVDGNVRRVVSRLFDVAAPAPAFVRGRAAEMVDPARPGDFNQALMELGATVCTPRNPACPGCPLQHLCAAHANGTVAERPGSKIRKPVPHERVFTLICTDGFHVRLRQRPHSEMLGGLWEFPECAALPAASRRIGEVVHIFSHKRITYEVYLCSSELTDEVTGEWIAIADLPRYPLSTAQRKVERLFREVRSRFAPEPCPER